MIALQLTEHGVDQVRLRRAVESRRLGQEIRYVAIEVDDHALDLARYEVAQPIHLLPFADRRRAAQLVC